MNQEWLMLAQWTDYMELITAPGAQLTDMAVVVKTVLGSHFGWDW